MHNFKFSAHTLTVNGKSWPVEYIPDPSGALLLFVTVDEADADNDAIIVIKPEDSLFAAASAAANEAEQTEAAPEAVETVQPAANEAEQTEAAPEAVETVQPAEEAEQAEEAPEAAETVQPAEEAEQVEEAPEAVKPDPKQAHGPIPEKTFIGTEIPLPCGKVLFDPETERTRIILNDSPAADVVEKVKAAGFFYSPRTKSYNKKLTFRAYRAAVKLAAELNAA